MSRTTRVTIFILFLFRLSMAQPIERPNILWIVSEDNNITFTHSYGNSFATTPNIDKLATEGIRYKNAFATAPVCAPSRCSLITGMYPPSMGTEHMRSTYATPGFVKFFPWYLREAGYYTTNNSKKDYNTNDQLEAWDESSEKATYKNRKAGQPFFAVFNFMTSHESSIHKREGQLHHDPAKVKLPPYHPDTKEFREDWAQYYDKVETMDQQVGNLLQELESDGLADNTIVFYYSDNGGVLPRSKRFMFESGLHVPLIVRLPEKYQNFSPDKTGDVTERLVSFIDFAPTVLSLAGIQIPDYLPGKAFLGKQIQQTHEYVYAFRGRMDERIDMSRSVRDKKYRYIRNYLPHLIYGQHLEYLWRSASMRSWEKEYHAGRLSETQSKFWKPKPAEELYDVEDDPDNAYNLAGEKAYEKILQRMRAANRQWLIDSKDLGFFPEAMLYRLSKGSLPFYEQLKDKEKLKTIIETAEISSSRDPRHLPEILKRLKHPEAAVRYWAAIGCIVLKQHAGASKDQLNRLLKDPEIAVRVAAAQALYYQGEKKKSVESLTEVLKNENAFARLQALNVLQTFGKDAAEALQVAKTLLKDNPQDADYDARAARTLVETIEY